MLIIAIIVLFNKNKENNIPGEVNMKLKYYHS